MAFRRLKNYSPQNPSVDPRVSAQWALNSSHCVITITPYPTLKELIANDPAGIANTRMLGLITDMSRSENINVTTFFDIGDKRPIHVPGKAMNSLNLNSGMLECVNLLGSVYETILDGLNKRYNNRFKKNPLDEMLIRPVLTETYYEDKALSLDGGNKATAVKPVATSGGFTINDTIDQGAILLSMNDIRLRIKFGLCFLIFQDEERIKNSILGLDTFGPAQAVLEDEKKFNLIGGTFLENCLITSYGSTISSNSAISSPVEALNIVYNDTKILKNIQQETT